MVGTKYIFIPKPFDFCSKGLKNLTFLVICFCQTEIYAQVGEEKDTLSLMINDRKSVYQNNYLRLVEGNFMIGAQSTLDEGNIQLNPVLGWGHYLSLVYGIALNQTFSLEVGIIRGLYPIYMAYNISAEENNLLWDIEDNIKELPIDFDFDWHYGFLAFPLRLVTRSPLFQNIYGNVKLGINFRNVGTPWKNFSYNALCIGCYENEERVLKILKAGGVLTNRFKLTYDFAIGLSYQLKNHDLIDFNLVANLSPYRVINGTYTFFPNEPDLQQFRSEGTYYSYANYLGFEIGYTFTKAGKIARRIKKDARKAWRRFNK